MAITAHNLNSHPAVVAEAPRRVLRARIADDLILKVRKAEGWPHIEGDKLATIKHMNALYSVTATRDGWYVATPKVA